MGKRKTCEQLVQFVRSGGTLILETGFGLFDEHYYYNPVIPPHDLSEAFGYREQQSFLIRAQSPPPDASPSDLIYYRRRPG